MDVTIRLARANDEARIRDLLKRFEGEVLPAWRDSAPLQESLSKEAEKLFTPLSGDYVLLVCADEDDRPIGFAQAMMDKDHFSEEPQGHLLFIVTDEQHEGKGVARRLVTAVEDWAWERGATGLQLYVFATNLRARAAYQHFGFEEDMVTMVKPLSKPKAERRSTGPI